ncbi:MAG: GGDEF domain-containing protein, partial [Oleiphilaceae bacterium]|nr:GGDEF domain-containing protein [Oleiphilaceae bacterium]
SLFAGQMEKTYRSSDILGRLGGDEFAVLLVNTDKEDAESFVSRFQDELKKQNQDAGSGYEIPFSYGVVEFDPDKGSTVETLLAEADALMYELKRSRK